MARWSCSHDRLASDYDGEVFDIAPSDIPERKDEEGLELPLFSGDED